MSEPTVASLLRNQHRLYVTCAACQHERGADLEQLAARGWADRPPVEPEMAVRMRQRARHLHGSADQHAGDAPEVDAREQRDELLPYDGEDDDDPRWKLWLRG